MGEEQVVGQAKPFAAWLQEQRNGALHTELSEALAEVAAAALEHNKPGKVTLTISVKPAAVGQPTVFVADEVKTVIPQAEKPTSLFFADGRGNLTRRDPRQAELPLRDVSAPDAKPLRRAGND